MDEIAVAGQLRDGPGQQRAGRSPGARRGRPRRVPPATPDHSDRPQPARDGRRRKPLRDLFADEQERVWVGVHFGSRGFGHKTASGFLALAQGYSSPTARQTARCTLRQSSSSRAARAGTTTQDGDCPRCGQSRIEKRPQPISPGPIDFGAVQAELAARRVESRGGAADEAPRAYKRLDQVLAAHGETIRVSHRLRPLGVAMAGAGVEDPYKD